MSTHVDLRRRSQSLPRLVLCGAALALVACGDRGGGGDGWRGSMETLSGGAVLVRNPAEGAWRAGEAWTLAEELRIGSMEAEGPALFSQVAAVEADALGRVWVLDGQAKELRVFDPQGRHVRTIGREGGGPGEFRDPIGMAWAPDGSLWVPDPGAARFTVFDSAGRFVASHPRRVAGYSIPWRGGFGADGRLREIAVVVGAGSAPRQALLRYDAAVQPADTVLLPDFSGPQFELRRGTSMWAAGIPFTPGQVFALDPSGGVWTGVNDRYRFARLGPRGDTTRIVERQAAPVPVTAAERGEAVAQLKWFTDQGGRIDAGRIPGVKPAYEQIFLDADGGTWVRPAVAASESGTAFDVFDPEGRYRGRVRLSTGLDPYPTPLVRGDALYGVRRDSLDVAYVVRVRILRGG